MLHASRSVRYFEATSSLLLESLTAMTSLFECFTFLTQVSSLDILLFDVNGGTAPLRPSLFLEESVSAVKCFDDIFTLPSGVQDMYDEIAIESLVDFGYIHRIYVDF